MKKMTFPALAAAAFFVAPALAAFGDRHPEVTVDLWVTNRMVDLVAESDLMRLDDSVRGVIASCVAAMPEHEAFIERCCKASAAA